jgi:glycosyltransferase involved in cell wall biosynthesis
VQRYALETSIQIKALVDDVMFIAPNGVVHPDLASLLDVRIVGTRKGHLWEQIDLPAYLRKLRNPPLLSLANTAPLLYTKNYIVIHDLAFIYNPSWTSLAFSKWYSFLIPRIAKRARHLFTVSDTIRKELIQVLHLPTYKVSVAYNGLAAQFLQSGHRLQPRKKQVLAVGTFNKRKNHDRLIQAFLQSTIVDQYELLIVGNREEIFRDYPQMAASNRIRIITRPDDEELATLYKESEILVSLSEYEGFGLPVLEGLYFGCKVLCSDIPVYKELYRDYVYFCDPRKPEEISSMLSIISADNQEQKVLPFRLDERYSYVETARILCDTIFAAS